MSIVDALKDVAEDVAVKALAEGARVLIDEFQTKQPDAAQKALAAIELAKQVAELMPRDMLAAFLTDDDAAQALAIARFAKAIKLQGM